MKFSDMMGKRDRGTTEVTEPQLPPEAASAPPVPEAPIRFGGNRSELGDAAAAVGGVAITQHGRATAARRCPATFTAAPAPVVEPDGPPSIRDVVAELAPRPAAATDQQLDTSAWLDGINSIDDDLLPR